MPAFSNRLPTGEKHMGYDLRRTPPASPLRAIITSDDLLCCDTHWYGGRTLPCERKQLAPDGTPTAGSCAACNDAMPFRTHVYVSVFDGKTHEHYIFECSALAAKPLEEYRAANGTLRGCAISATRPKGKGNSKVVIETCPTNLARVTLPTAPDLARALCVIWRIPCPTDSPATETVPDLRSPDGHAAAAPTFRPDAAKLKRQREQPDYAADPTACDATRAAFLDGLKTASRKNGHSPKPAPTK